MPPIIDATVSHYGEFVPDRVRVQFLVALGFALLAWIAWGWS